MQRPGLELLAVDQLKKINAVAEGMFVLEEKYELSSEDIYKIVLLCTDASKLNTS